MHNLQKIKIGLFLLLFICYSYFWHRPNWNDLGRFDLIMAIAELGTVKIDAFHINTGDKAFMDGHYYSDKAPGPAFLGVPIYWVLDYFMETTGLYWNQEQWITDFLWRIKLWIIQIFIIAIPSALMGVLLFQFLLTLGLHLDKSIWLTLGYSLGTLAFPYSTLFYGHQFATICIFSSFYILYKQSSETNKNIHWFGLSGFLSGYAVLSEYPVLLLAILLMGYSIYKTKDWKSILIYIIGFTIPIFILLYYNYLCTGSPFKVGYFQVAGEEFRKEMEKGIAGVTYPKLSALWGITFSLYRGLFIFNPLLLFALPGLYYLYKYLSFRKEFWLYSISILVFLIFNSSYYMWWGGWSLGPRHLIPIIPFLILPIAFLPKNYWKYIISFILYSILLMWAGTAVNPQVPDNIQNPITGYIIPNLFHGEVSPSMGILFGASIPGSPILLGGIMLLGITLLFRLVRTKK